MSSSVRRKLPRNINNPNKRAVVPDYVQGATAPQLSHQENTTIHIGYNVFNPIYDKKTKNKSFIDVYTQLKLLGIKNCEFHLTLLYTYIITL